MLEAAAELGEPTNGRSTVILIVNVMMDEATGQAVGLIDLDTVKLDIHYDIGDCLRSFATFGEETRA